MTKDKQIEENFSDILSMLKKKVQQKDEEIMRLREENTKLKEKLTEIDPDFVLEETFKRRQCTRRMGLLQRLEQKVILHVSCVSL